MATPIGSSIRSKRAAGADERLASTGRLTQLLRRPEAGAAGGLMATIIIFALLPGAANLYSLQGSMTFLTLSAELGIIATAAALLIIAGEFDLSVGSMIGFAGVVIGLTVRYSGLPLWGGIACAFAVAILVGYLNGLIVVKTRLPSFIVTLASLFILRGLSIGITRAVTGRTQIPYILDGAPDPATRRPLQRPCPHRPVPLDGRAGLDRHAQRRHPLRRRHPDVDRLVARHHRAGRLCPDPDQVRQLDLRHRWRCRCVARNVGVPVDRVKISLFICTACAATLLATIQVMEAGSADTHARPAQGVRGDHRRRHRRRAADRRLRHGLWRAVRRPDLRPRADGHLLYRHRHRLVQGLPRHSSSCWRYWSTTTSA